MSLEDERAEAWKMLKEAVSKGDALLAEGKLGRFATCCYQIERYALVSAYTVPSIPDML